jgi:hypothetical protein
MKNFKFIVVALFCAATLGAAAAPARAQIATDSGVSVVVKQKPAKAVWLKAEVIHADRRTLIVREVDNSMEIHTFTYSVKAQDKINQVLDEGGYQRGDLVKVLWFPGSSEALKIKGRPSKSS